MSCCVWSKFGHSISRSTLHRVVLLYAFPDFYNYLHYIAILQMLLLLSWLQWAFLTFKAFYNLSFWTTVLFLSALFGHKMFVKCKPLSLEISFLTINSRFNTLVVSACLMLSTVINISFFVITWAQSKNIWSKSCCRIACKITFLPVYLIPMWSFWSKIL